MIVDRLELEELSESELLKNHKIYIACGIIFLIFGLLLASCLFFIEYSDEGKIFIPLSSLLAIVSTWGGLAQFKKAKNYKDEIKKRTISEKDEAVANTKLKKLVIMIISIIVIGSIAFPTILIGFLNEHTNEYGTSSSVCAVSGCTRKIASSGDTNCCTFHSNRCGNCSCYIDRDAMYCMKCIKKSLYK